MLFCLQSKAINEDDYFYESLLCIVEKNTDGALGFILNRPFSRTLNELQEFSFLPPFSLYEGGPVSAEHLYFLHRRSDIIEGGKHISDDMYLGGDFKQVSTAISKGILKQNDIRIFIGYCGWDTNELEEEIKQGAWEIAEANVFL